MLAQLLAKAFEICFSKQIKYFHTKKLVSDNGEQIFMRNVLKTKQALTCEFHFLCFNRLVSLL